MVWDCLLYTSDAADEEDSGDLGGRGIYKKKKTEHTRQAAIQYDDTNQMRKSR